MSLLDSWGEFVATMSLPQITPVERALQDRHMADTLIAAVVGLKSVAYRKMRPLFEGGVDQEAMQLAAAVRMTEIDDIHLASCTTPSSVTAPVGLALGSERDCSDVRVALAVGTELIVRFGEAVAGPELLYRNVWPTYLAAPLGAAATAARLLGLDSGAAANALGLALTLTAGGSGRFAEAHSPRWLLHSRALGEGLFAARAAALGYEADRSLLDSDWLSKTHGIAIDRDRLNVPNSAGVYLELSLKPYSSAKQAIAAIEAFRNLLEGGVSVVEIDDVIVRVPPTYAEMIERAPVPGQRNYASIRYQLALAALHPMSLFQCVGEGMPWSEEIIRFMARIKVQADPSLSAHYPKRWPASVAVKASGQWRQYELINAPGDPENRLDESEFANKAERVLAAVGESASTWLPLGAHCLDSSDALTQAREKLSDVNMRIASEKTLRN